jgi:hypothetical protein
MAKIKKLNQNNEDLYPVTLEDAVFDTEGVNIGTKIQDIKDNMIQVEDFDEIEDIENSYLNNSIFAPKIYKYIKDFGAVGDGITDDTDAIQKALNEQNSIIEFEVGKVYKISKPLKMKYGVEIIGNKSTIIIIDPITEPLISIGHSCEIRNLIINLNQNINTIDVPVLDINSEYLKLVYTEYADAIWYGSVFNIYLDNVRVYKWRSDDSCSGSALNIEATGKGFSGWGIQVSNCNFLGHFDKAITIQTIQRYDDAEDVMKPYMNDIKFDNCKINYSKIGFYLNNEILSSIDNTDKIPRGPEAIRISNCSMQAQPFSSHFAEIIMGNRIYFNDCEPWDWHIVTDENAYMNPYKIHNNEFNYSISISRGNYITEGNIVTTPIRKIKGEPVLDEASTLTDVVGSGDNGVFTFGDLYKLTPGSYHINNGTGNMLGLVDKLVYGGMLLVFNGFKGSKIFMIQAATIIDSECNMETKNNVKMYIMCIPLRYLQKTDAIINTTLAQNHWIKIMDNTCIGIDGFIRPLVEDLDNILESDKVNFIGAKNTANGSPNNRHFNGISIGGNNSFHYNNALGWQLGADSTQKNLVFRIKTSKSEDSWTEWGQIYGSKNMPYGSSTYRPTDVSIGSVYFDRTLNKPIWCKTAPTFNEDGSILTNAVWVDATGAEV